MFPLARRFTGRYRTIAQPRVCTASRGGVLVFEVRGELDDLSADQVEALGDAGVSAGPATAALSGGAATVGRAERRRTPSASRRALAGGARVVPRPLTPQSARRRVCPRRARSRLA